VFGNTVTQNYYDGIILDSNFNDTVSANNVSGNYGDGIYVTTSCFNETVLGNEAGGNSGDAISVDGCSNVTVSGNNVTGNGGSGIAFYSHSGTSSGNVVFGNGVVGNRYGILLDNSLNNTIYHNNFINNTQQVAISGSEPNTWDDGYPSGGNYWSNYTGSDSHSSPYQNETGSDGIGDTPYVIDANNTDHYPLMGPITSFGAGTWNGTSCNVDIVSNSTVSNLQVDVADRTVSFNLTGPASTYGFCRLTIPNVIVQDLWHGNFTVLIDNEQWPFTNWTDASYTYVYINYTHSEHEVVIIQEFPSTVAVWLFIALSTIAVVLANRRTPRKTQNQTRCANLARGIKTPPVVSSHLPHALPYYP
jgi:parallel beta-helix repeat protein